MPPKDRFQQASQHCISRNGVCLLGKEDAEKAKHGGGQGAGGHKAAVQYVLINNISLLKNRPNMRGIPSFFMLNPPVYIHSQSIS